MPLMTICCVLILSVPVPWSSVAFSSLAAPHLLKPIELLVSRTCQEEVLHREKWSLLNLVPRREMPLSVDGF